MAHTQDPIGKNARHAGTQAESVITPRPTENSTAKGRQSKRSHETEDMVLAPAEGTTVNKSKRPRKADDTAAIESGPPATSKRANSAVSKAKRQHEADDTTVTDSEQGIPTKKAKTAPMNIKKIETQPKPGGRRSSRAQTKTPKATTARRTRRTKEEIAADKAKVDAEKKRQKELTEENHQAMARMDVNEDFDRAETAAHVIRTFSDLNHDSAGEEFIGYDEILSGDDSDTDNESKNYSEDAKNLKKANRALEERLKVLEVKLAGSKRSVGGGKKLAKKVTFASGLLPDWNSDKETPKKRTHIQISAGGLDDSDAEAVNPFPEGPLKSNTIARRGSQTAKRDLSRRNELVSIVNLTEDDEEYIPHPAAKKVATKKEKIPHARVKTQKQERDQVIETTVMKKTKRLTGNNVRISDLPEFAQAKWRETFLPTLYDQFFTSDQPFDGFCRGSDQFITLLQGIIEEVYPDVDYEVTSADSIHFLAYNRINEKRSSIGSNAINIVKQHISTLNGENAAKDWLRWSLRMDGPLFFKVPSPPHSPVDNKDPQYKFPEGRLLSQFVIGLATPLISLRSGSASENGFPKGLISLIMAALERAVRYLSKPSIKAREFSKEFWGSKVDTYYSGFQGKNGIPDARWEELLDACSGVRGLSDSENARLEADLSILDNSRGFVFNFCSPAKSRS